jgi:hypothetical protein
MYKLLLNFVLAKVFNGGLKFCIVNIISIKKKALCIKLGIKILKQFCILNVVKRGTDYPTFKENVTNWSCS